jgi:hypothetical protein
MMQYFWMFCAGAIAFGKGRGMLRWILAAYFLSWFAPAVLMFLPMKVDKYMQREARLIDWAEGLVTKKEVKEVNNVYDLFKQLEKK